ncbi:uncharacterized protein [Miscanthus floridulus]|uniref:uncharacterized protein n=1 Tax=Miscanthus floridulus TaxID=154761 RepID=UPI0034586DB9
MERNGDTDLSEECTVEKFHRCMLRKYAQIIMSIETLLDFKQLTMEDVTRRLKAHDIKEGVKGLSFPLSGSVGSAELHLNEPCAHAFLSIGVTDDKIDGWYLDIDATHHMTSQHKFFSDLDSSVKGFINFSDASAVVIKGIGLVIFKAKVWEHRLLTRLYYILALKKSIISVGQLDENGSWVEIEDGMLRI